MLYATQLYRTACIKIRLCYNIISYSISDYTWHVNSEHWQDMTEADRSYLYDQLGLLGRFTGLINNRISFLSEGSLFSSIWEPLIFTLLLFCCYDKTLVTMFKNTPLTFDQTERQGNTDCRSNDMFVFFSNYRIYSI